MLPHDFSVAASRGYYMLFLLLSDVVCVRVRSVFFFNVCRIFLSIFFLLVRLVVMGHRLRERASLPPSLPPCLLSPMSESLGRRKDSS